MRSIGESLVISDTRGKRRIRSRRTESSVGRFVMPHLSISWSTSSNILSDGVPPLHEVIQHGIAHGGLPSLRLADTIGIASTGCGTHAFSRPDPLHRQPSDTLLPAECAHLAVRPVRTLDELELRLRHVTDEVPGTGFAL